jgi:hypothetical protein
MNRETECQRNRMYGVGFRVLTDLMLLRQIRAEIACNAMELEEIAQLENVTAEQLLAILRNGPDEGGLGALLRSFARSRPGHRVAAWRTSRHHASKLHLLDGEGVPFCGTIVGENEIAVDTGGCVTCALRAGIAPHISANVDSNRGRLGAGTPRAGRVNRPPKKADALLFAK